MKDVIVLQHAQCEGPGTIADALAGAKFSLRTIRGDLGQPIPADLRNAAALIAMGGPMSVYEQDRFPFLGDELRLIERGVRANLPVLGVCLGSQLLAAALGAKVGPGSKKEIGWHRVRLGGEAPADGLLRDAPREFVGFHWHGDVYDLPRDAVLLASSDLTACQAFRYGSAHGVLFHMEVTRDSIAGMTAAFPRELTEAGVCAESLALETDRFLAPLQSIGSRAFARWAAALEP